MKILMVAIPNHHFFQWVSQLKESGYEVYWFDITDGAGFIEKINWVQQFNGWRLKWNYPFRYKLKKHIPKLHSLLEKVTVNTTETVFENIIKQIQPDLVHCFEMQLAGLPILSVMNNNKIPFVYSSWGSDLFDYQSLGVTAIQAKSFLDRVDYLITDCNRDFKIAQKLGVPRNGGLAIETSYIESLSNRKTICIKGYDDGVGKAVLVLKAIELIPLDNTIAFLIFSADEIVANYMKNSDYFKLKKVEIISRNSFLTNKLLLQKLGSCLVYIGNSGSDGMPNSLLEAMGMGVFPIQSNPGNVTEEVVANGINGYLIQNPDDVSEIANHIMNVLQNEILLENSKKHNVQFIAEHYNRNQLKDKIVSLYKTILQTN
jgi:glycosyltransferase involved in cell wall biosynthesis